MRKKIDELMEENAELKSQLAEAVGLLREVNSQRFTTLATVEIIESFIGRHSQTFHDHAQAEQQEAKPATFADAIMNPPRLPPRLKEAQGAQAGMELVGYANFDQLDNMLDDRTATLHPKKTGFAGTPVYRARAALATQPAAEDHDQAHQLAFEVGEPDEDGDGYHFSAEQLDEFVSKLNAVRGAEHE